MGVIAEAVRHMLAAGMDALAVADAVAAMEAATPAEGLASRNADATERKRAADRERMRRKRGAAKPANGRQDDGAKSHEVANCRATSATPRDGCDPSPEAKRKVSPCTPSKEKTHPSPIPTPSVPNGTSSPSAVDRNATDRHHDLAEAMAAFNRMAAEVGLPEAQGLSRKRQASLRQRLTECGGLEGWRIAMDRVRTSPFLRGDNDRGWRAGLDFLLKTDSFAKLMEGAYDPAPGARRQRAEPVNPLLAAAASVLAEHPDSEFGQRARTGGYVGGRNLRGGDAILAGMARVAEHRFGQWVGSSDGQVIDGAADELLGDYADD